MRQIAIALFPMFALAAADWAAGAEAPQPSTDVRLTVRTRGDQTTFHLGEVISLELSFTGTAQKKYNIDMASYDRSGRLNEETFSVQPEAGWEDPLYLYFHAYQGFFGGGLRGINPLSAEPTRVIVELNEWVQFRAAGQYRVRIASTRVGKVDRRPGDGWISVASNELLLTIVPATPEWQRETLRHALAALDGSKPAPTQAASQPDPTKDAVKALRYLGTPAAAREMARRFNDPYCASDCGFGLIGSPAREAGLDEMRRLLADPDFPVTNHFLGTMSVVGLPADAAGDLPAQRQRLETAFRQELVSAIGTKRGAALAASANTIVEEAAISSRELEPELKRAVTAQLVASFDQLPVEKQAELLQSRWKTLDQQAMLPLLEKVAQRYRDAPLLYDRDIWEYNNASAAALEHWYELDPARARSTIMREILRPKPRFGASVLGMLPDRELPEVEGTLMDHLLESEGYGVSENLASLIHRYASRAMEAQVLGYLDDRVGKLACSTQESLLAYLLKVDPVAAGPQLEKALAAGGKGFSICERSLLSSVGRLRNDPFLQDIAIHRLDDADPRVVGNAAAYLGEFGSAAAEQALWTHFTAWSERWISRQADLDYLPGHNLDGFLEASAGADMMQALATAQGWLADEPQLRRLIQLSVGAQQRRTIEQWLQLWQTRPLPLQFIASEGAFLVAQYRANSLQAAKEKLLQFPGGTAFQWLRGGPQDGDEKAFQEVSAFAVQHGIQIARSGE
jgi:hypothetical protein